MKLWTKFRTTLCRRSRQLSLTVRGQPITEKGLFNYTNGRFLINEAAAFDRRFLKFNVDALCDVVSNLGGGGGTTTSRVTAIEKLEGGFSRALLMKRDDGVEVVAKLPFKIAGPERWTTAAEVATLEYLHQYTKIPVPRVLNWSCDASNPVGSEYIIMTKAHGVQLVTVWSKMVDTDKLTVIKQLASLMCDVAAIKFPANGALYLRESLTKDDEMVLLDDEVDPAARFCIGPSCDRGWPEEKAFRKYNKPAIDLVSFGHALVEREIARIERRTEHTENPGFPHGSKEEQLADLKLAKEVMSRMTTTSLPGMFSAPALWHSDLHLGNIYVDENDPSQISCLIDWQGNVIRPLLCQVRFPAFLDIGDDYEYDIWTPKLPDDINERDEDERQVIKHRHRQQCLAKIYEAGTGRANKHVWNALKLPFIFKELFIRSGEVSQSGIIPVRECLINISEAWDDAELSGPCPITFSEHEKTQQRKDFEEYSEFHRIRERAYELLGTDSEGWIHPSVDFEQKKQQSREMRQGLIDDCQSLGKTAAQMQVIWPF